MRKRLLILGVFVVLVFGSLEILRRTYEHAAKKMEPTLSQEVAAIEKRYGKHPAPAGSVLFVGSSSLRRWASLEQDMHPMQVLNHGFGGSQMSDVIEYRARLVDPFRPKAVVIYAGDNDLGRESQKTSAGVSADYRKLVLALRASNPKLLICCLSIKASPSRMGRWPLMQEVNRSMQAWCSGQAGVEYIDVASPLLDRRGLPRPDCYLSDGIHLAAPGYEKWTAVIRGVLRSKL